ncbi:MAG: choice-of-anchor L domain-containing protein [Cyclobacteriaceae bacterium]
MNLVVQTFIKDEAEIKVSKVKYTGNRRSIGLFNNRVREFPIDKGIILSTGDVHDAIGPNNKSNSGVNRYFKGDAELELLANGETFDATILEFDFEANTDSISFEFVFASEEYPEYVNKGVNDVFAFFITDLETRAKSNIAECRGLPITVDNINSGKNADYFISNRKFNLREKDNLTYSLQYDGLTTKLSTGLKITPYKLYHFKICIADVGDGFYDSSVMLRAESFVSNGKFEIDSIIDDLLIVTEKEFDLLQSDSNSVNLIPNIEFAFDSYTIPDTSMAIIDRLAEIMAHYYDFSMEIYGYADNIGTKEYNLGLSLNRSKSIYDSLVTRGISENRISYYGFGSANPITENETASDRAKNRRVKINLYKH